VPAIVLVVTAVAVWSVSVAACGFGTYDDTGAAVPGQWWPWVCADGGSPSGEGGCNVDDDAGEGS